MPKVEKILLLQDFCRALGIPFEDAVGYEIVGNLDLTRFSGKSDRILVRTNHDRMEFLLGKGTPPELSRIHKLVSAFVGNSPFLVQSVGRRSAVRSHGEILLRSSALGGVRASFGEERYRKLLKGKRDLFWGYMPKRQMGLNNHVLSDADRSFLEKEFGNPNVSRLVEEIAGRMPENCDLALRFVRYKDRVPRFYGMA